MSRTFEWREGAKVVCPKCGQPGTLKVDTFKAAGRAYKYWVVRHIANSNVKRCIIERFEEGKPLRSRSPPAEQPLFPQPVEEKVLDEEEGGKEEVVEEAAVQPVRAPPKAESYPRELQRRAWYVAKLGSSVGAFKENATRENLERLKNTVAQIIERLGVPATDLLEAAERYFETESDTAKMRLNETLTLVICRIFSSLPHVEKRGKGGEAVTGLAAAVEALEEKVSALAEKIESLSLPPPVEREKTVLNIEQLAAAVAEEVVKRVSSAATARPSRRREVKGLKKMVLEILSDGRERKRVEIEKELEERFNVKAATSSLSGRLSELAKKGLIVKEKKGKDWYWRATGGGEGE